MFEFRPMTYVFVVCLMLSTPVLAQSPEVSDVTSPSIWGLDSGEAPTGTAKSGGEGEDEEELEIEPDPLYGGGPGDGTPWGRWWDTLLDELFGRFEALARH